MLRSLALIGHRLPSYTSKVPSRRERVPVKVRNSARFEGEKAPRSGFVFGMKDKHASQPTYAASHGVEKARLALGIFGKVLLLCPLFLAGCAADRESGLGSSSATGTPIQPSGDQISYWDDHGTGGRPHILVNLNEQRAYFYRGNNVVGLSIVSTGREGFNTPSGEFRVTEKDPTHVSSIYGDYVDRTGQVVVQNVDVDKDPRPRGTVFQGAPMPYFLRINGGIGLHAGYLPGYPASHGCIRLPKEMALHFYQNVAVGTPVAVRAEEPPQYRPNPLAMTDVQR
jgi:lipoprotein-anchoring transpeptidase ErfK/SrfK